MKDRLTILCGDALEQLKTLPDESVHCCVTSPPYWGLRDYGTAKWEGGDLECDHSHYLGGNGAASAKQVTSGGTQKYQFRDVCGKCGAKRIDNQIGLERTPEEYVAKMVEVFREVKRVLRDDGTCWVNLGDSYARQAGDDSTKATDSGMKTGRTGKSELLFKSGNNVPPPGLKPKDLCGIPWRVAFALQSDGWYLRSDIIWHKPNPMPESVTDRPTKSHEYLFLLSKNERYFYDAEAIKEKFADERMGNPGNYLRTPSSSKGANNDRQDLGFLNNGNGWNADQSLTGRNKRSVWTVPSFAFPESHFATYPPDLIKPCILAGTSAKGCCEKCGAPWERLVESERTFESGSGKSGNPINGKQSAVQGAGYGDIRMGPVTKTKTIGWQPTCECGDMVNDGEMVGKSSFKPVPCTVLDPFAGSGTTGAVALELGRKAILIELNPEYVHLIKQRCDVTPGLPLA